MKYLRNCIKTENDTKTTKQLLKRHLRLQRTIYFYLLRKLRRHFTVTCQTLPGGYKTVFMLNSTQHEIHSAHFCWHFYIYQQNKYTLYALRVNVKQLGITRLLLSLVKTKYIWV